MVLLCFCTRNWPHRVKVEGRVVGLGVIIGLEGVVLMVLLAVIS